MTATSQLFIFEAKNWNARIGKDHILVFSAKIKAACAQAGYFVAKTFSKYARAAAKNDPRIRLLHAADDFALSDTIKNFHVTHQNLHKSDSRLDLLFKKGQGSLDPASFNMKDATPTLNGAPFDYMMYGQSIVHRLVAEHSLTVPSHYMESGEHWFDLLKEVETAPDILVVGGLEVDKIRVKIRYCFEIVRARVISKFDIETRGRVYTYEGIPLEGLGVQHIRIIEREGVAPFFTANFDQSPS